MMAAHPLFRLRLIVLAAFLACGCQRQPNAPLPAGKERTATATAPPASARPAAEVPAKSAPPTRGDWSERFGLAQQALAGGRLEEAEAALASLDELDAGGQLPTAEQERQRQDLALELAAARQAALDKKRDAWLTAADEALASGRYLDALRLAADVVNSDPSRPQQQRAADIRVEVRRRQQVRKSWQPQIELLASSSRRDLETIQAELKKEPDVALPLLAELSRRTENPALAAGALESLRVLDRPQQALPLLVDVLSRDSQRELWEVARRQIVELRHPGAGQTLLDLAVSDSPIERRLIALDALSQVIDPPRETLVALLPILHADGPLVRPALQSVAHAAEVHGQRDLTLYRSLARLTGAQREQLERLPARLQQLSAAADGSAQDVAIAAQALAVALRLQPPEPLAVLKVQASADAPEHPAAALIDGIWDSADGRTMWRHPADEPGTITLDLGRERTIVFVKLWNWNEPAGASRGWKDAEISIGKSEAELSSVARGVVPPAPGAAGMPDYGTLISVPCVRGRYVRIQAASFWQMGGGHSGLAEVQVLGF